MSALRVLVPPTLSDPDGVAVVRSSGRGAALATLGAIAGVGGLVAVQVSTVSARAVAVLVTALALAVGWAVFVRPVLYVAPAGLTVVGALRTRQLAWADITGFDAGVALVVRCRDGRRVDVPAVPGRLFDDLRRGTSVPQVVAVALGDRLARVRARGAGDAPPAAVPRTALSWPEVGLVVAGAVAAVGLVLLLDR